MSIETLKKIIKDDSLTDEELELMLARAIKIAVNHYFWGEDDKPSEEEIEAFCDRYEFEIYDLIKAVYDNNGRQGLKQFTELGVTRVWDTDGDASISKVLSQIPVKTYLSVL